MSTSLQIVTTPKLPYVLNAYLEDVQTIYVKLSDPLSFPLGARGVVLTDKTTGDTLAVSAVSDGYMPRFVSSTVIATTLVIVTLVDAPPLTHTLEIELSGYLPARVIPRNVLNTDMYLYAGDDLGNTFTPEATTFRVWSPTAATVHLLLYEHETSSLSHRIPMMAMSHGVWCVEVPQNLHHWYYLYEVTIHGETRTAVDPYVRALAVNATRGMIVDLRTTDPSGWEEDHYLPLADPVDAAIYETHVRDFSSDPHSGMVHQGKYLAFTERDTYGSDHVSTGVSSLLDLGITHVHLLPVADFASIDETRTDQYNWGYDPRTYNVPLGAYATTPHGTARITEFKQLVQSLHRSHLGVIIDVVYNHTFVTQTSAFDQIVPQYYYRTNYAGDYTNGSGCGNEIASERPMVQKFIRDSVRYWLTEYHLDGLRFDLMALLGVETMRQISQDLHALNPGVLLYGEAWTGGPSALPAEELLLKGQQKKLGVSVFNDQLRDALAGRVFDAYEHGFATGAPDQVDLLRRCVIGSIDDFTAAPGETINYASSHDNMTLWDKIAMSNAMNTEEERIRMHKLAQAVVITAQGVPFLQGGEEFLRTKGGSHNSYNAGDMVNRLDWSRKAHYVELFDYYAGLFWLRRHHPAFRITEPAVLKRHLTFLSSPQHTLAFLLHDHPRGDAWNNILVIYNPNPASSTFILPVGRWILVATPALVDENSTLEASGSINVPAISCLILYQN